jgi:very-short-patch-repair endonuclease
MSLSAYQAALQLGGIASRKEIVGLSSEKRVRRALERGTLTMLPGRRVAVNSSERAHRAASSFGGLASHASAALLMEWPVLTVPERPQITVQPGRSWPDEPLEVPELFERHWGRTDHDGWHTNALRTVLDCARDLPFADALTVADSALRSEALEHVEMLEASQRLRGPHAARVRRVAAYADGRAANPLESALRALCIEVGLDVVPQWEVAVDGFTVHPDLANPPLGLAIEAESHKHHALDPDDFESDCERYDLLVIAGWRVLRFTYRQVTRGPDWVRKVLRQAKRGLI